MGSVETITMGNITQSDKWAQALCDLDSCETEVTIWESRFLDSFMTRIATQKNGKPLYTTAKQRQIILQMVKKYLSANYASDLQGYSHANTT